jgi:hypothetical protein
MDMEDCMPTNKDKIIKVFTEEYRSIQKALKAAGYYAYNIKFRPHDGMRPTIYLEAREWSADDKIDRV